MHQIPQVQYGFQDNQISGNEKFYAEFEKPIDQERLKFFIQENCSKDSDGTVAAKLYRSNEKEYIVFLSPPKDQKLQVMILGTELLSDVISSMAAFQKTEQEFYDILESMHDDFVIINKDGTIENALPNFEEMYGISSDEAIGKSVYEMEERKIFNPSIAIRVMKSLEKETLLQLTGAGKYLACTAIPVFDKSGELKKIISYTRDVTEYEELREEYGNLQEMLSAYSTQLGQLRNKLEKHDKIIGQSPAIINLISMVEKIAKFDANVLLTGESGVGKTLFAEAIHAASLRKNYPFITINCGAIPENLLESELFGYEKGAFTGANQGGKPGLIELADKGVLFLDEIGDLPLHMQVKLLKVIQDKKVIRVGGVNERHVDFRLIAASNKDMGQLIEEKVFREDLYYRLNVLSMHIPPLRERREDVFCLISHFAKKYTGTYNVSHAFSNKAINYLESYSWPGNTRELENIVERMVITADDYIISEDMLPTYIYSEESPEPFYAIKDRTLKEILEGVERQVILSCYADHKTTVKIAEVLGISQPSASLKLSKYLNKNQSTKAEGETSR